MPQQDRLELQQVQHIVDAAQRAGKPLGRVVAGGHAGARGQDGGGAKLAKVGDEQSATGAVRHRRLPRLGGSKAEMLHLLRIVSNDSYEEEGE